MSGVAIPLGVFREGDSGLHRLDPRIKFASMALVLTGVMLANNWFSGALVAVMAIASVRFGQIEPGESVHDIVSLKYFYVLTILLHGILDKGEVIMITIGKIQIFREGLNAGLFFCLKIALIAVIGGAISRTTHPADWSRGLENLFPSKGRSGRLMGRPGFVLGLAFRMLPVILTEAGRIRLAQVARGLEPGKGGIIRRTRSMLPLIVPLLYGTLHRADTLTAAMTSRGFNLDGIRTELRPLYTRPFDWITLLVATSVAAAAILPGRI